LPEDPRQNVEERDEIQDERKRLRELRLHEKECDDEIEKIDKYQADFLSRIPPRPRDPLGPEITTINVFFRPTENEIKYWRHQEDRKRFWLSERDRTRQQIRELEQDAATRGISYKELCDEDTSASLDAGEQSQNAAVHRRNATAKKIEGDPQGTSTTEEAAICLMVSRKTIRFLGEWRSQISTSSVGPQT
jgi:hypothetical protein